MAHYLSERVLSDTPIYRRGQRVVLTSHPKFPVGTRGKVTGHLRKYDWTDAGKVARYWGVQVTFDAPIACEGSGVPMTGTGNTASFDRVLSEAEWITELRAERAYLTSGELTVTSQEDHEYLMKRLGDVERLLALSEGGISLGEEHTNGRLCGRCARKIDQCEPIQVWRGRHYHMGCQPGPLAVEAVAVPALARTLAGGGEPCRGHRTRRASGVRFASASSRRSRR